MRRGTALNVRFFQASSGDDFKTNPKNGIPQTVELMYNCLNYSTGNVTTIRSNISQLFGTALENASQRSINIRLLSGMTGKLRQLSRQPAAC